MPTYQYEAMNAQGQEVKDEIDALSTEEAISKIRNLGYFPTKIREKGGRRQPKTGAAGIGAKPKRPSGTGGRVKVKKLTQFTRQLSTLQDAGLPILRSLRILEQQQKPGTLKKVCGAVANDVEGGATLSEAMAKYPKCFNNLYTNMVAAGEAGGVLDLILNRLADFMEKAQRLKSRIIGAMIYPIAVLTIAFLIVMGIMIFVIPKFRSVFDDFGVTLPAITETLLGISTWITYKWGWVYLLGSPIAFYLLIKLIRLSETGRYVLDSINLKIPVVGQIIGKTAVARFTRTLGTLISAGVPILEALNITRETSGNEVYRRALGSVHDNIRQGETFAEPLRKAKVCDSLVTNMIDVGEETGDLDKMLTKVADNYDDEVDTLVGSLVSLLEPIMVIGLGVICGFIVVALFMPMVSIITDLSGG
ncbi:MAG: type II secretion system F family protein [Sedimentisphaerales bacterium]|nr:type II secretion system F family protein [Sedimentisphaerales bacterium]